MSTREALKLDTGGLWEYANYEIQFNVNVMTYHDDIKPCKHAINAHISGDTLSDGPSHWVCPRAVVALNEGGYNSTGVCLDCIIEVAQDLQ
jgi:hypothetical protein